MTRDNFSSSFCFVFVRYLVCAVTEECRNLRGVTGQEVASHSVFAHMGAGAIFENRARPKRARWKKRTGVRRLKSVTVPTTVLSNTGQAGPAQRRI